MKYFIYASLLILFVGSSTALTAQTAQRDMTAIQFNDQLTDITDGLFAKGQEWGRRFNEAYKSKDFASLRPYRESLEGFVSTNINYVISMKDVSNSTDLRMAMLGFLRFEKEMIGKAFKPLEELPSSATAAEVTVKLKELQTYSALENAELQKVNIAQEAYAKANGFRIETAADAKKP